MSTRAYIARETRAGSGQYEFVYNHFDGDPDYLGRILKRNFNNTQRVDALMEQGDIRFINADGAIERLDEAGTSQIVTDSQLWDMFSANYINYLYIYIRGKWTAISNESGQKVDIP